MEEGRKGCRENERKDKGRKERTKMKRKEKEKRDLGLRGRYFPFASALTIGLWSAPVI